jgi:hypothetical protein
MQRESRATTMQAGRRAVREPFVPERTSGLASYPPPERWDDWEERGPDGQVRR